MDRGAYRGSGQFVRAASGSKITVSPGCMCEGLRVSGMGDVAWNVRDSIFLGGNLVFALADKFDTAGCLFQDIQISRSTRDNDLWSVSLTCDNCVIAGKFIPKVFSVTDYSVVANHCTFLDLTLPGIIYKSDPAQEAQSDKLKFAGCRFIRCEVPESFLAATVDCVFEDCTFPAKREDWSKASKPIPVNASVVGRLPASYVNWNLKVSFKLTPIAGTGAALKYSYANHRLAFAEVAPLGEPHMVGTVKNQPASITGAPAPGTPATPPETPSQPLPHPISPESQALTAQLVKTHRNNLVFVNGSNGSGSGFLAKFGTGTFLFTNAHVAAGVKGAGFKTLQGDAVQIGAPAVAVGHDIFLMQATAAQPLEIMAGVDENASIGDEIVVLGNAEGAGVINTIIGKIVGLGPNLVEVDAPFKPGNSGSPIIHLKSGKVIGAATYLTIRQFDSATKEKVKEPIVRRFGYRIDSVKKWQPVQWPAFLAQGQQVEAIEGLTEDLVKFLRNLAGGKIKSELQSNPQVKNHIESWMASRSHSLSPRDRQTVNGNFLAYLKVTCQSDITAAQSKITYDYFQRKLEEQGQERKQIAEVFDNIIRDIQNERN